MDRTTRRQIERKARKSRLKSRRRKGTAWNSSLRPGPWNKDGKPSEQTRKTLTEDQERSLWIRVLNASLGFTLNSQGGYYPGGAEGLKWGKCMLEGCNAQATDADHMGGRSGATSPSKTDPRNLGALCTHHNRFDKGSRHWADYRPERVKVLVEKLLRQHFREDPLKPGKWEMLEAGRAWIRDLHGSL